MAEGQILVLLLSAAVVTCQYTYPKPTKVRDFTQYVTNTQNWIPTPDGDRTCVLTTTKYSPDVCYLRFGLNAKYLNCPMEYLIVNGEKICGEVREYYQYPFNGGSWALRYRGRTPLDVTVDQVKCMDGGYETCDVITRDLKVEITSPNYPNEYPSGSNCQYTILPANEAVCQVSIYFHDFDVEDSANCRKDKLLIGSEPFCGRVANYRFNRNLTNNLIMRFVSDASVSGKGFRMSLEQIHCGNTVRYETRPTRECCEREYSDPYLVLTSPGFLGTRWTESNCRYVISASNPNVCRLRFYFRHFWVGEEDVFYGCVNGFVEIDRRRFCGCLDGYEHVSYLDGDGRKEVRYANSGPGNSGFVIEVYQEECGSEWNSTETDPNTEIEVFRTNVTSEKAVSRFLIPRDASRCLRPEWTKQARDFLESSRAPTHCTRNRLSSPQFQPGVGPGIFPPGEPSWPFPPPLGFPPRPSPGIFPPNWIVLYGPRGEFFSPGYPGRYPPNLRITYAFARLPSYYRVEVMFLDFDLEKSFKCWKDYLLLPKSGRYCGQSLLGTSVALEMHDDFAFLHFVTDGCFSGRGFRATYRLLPRTLRQFGSGQ